MVYILYLKISLSNRVKWHVSSGDRGRQISEFEASLVLQSKSQDSQGHPEKPCLGKPSQRTNKGTKDLLGKKSPEFVEMKKMINQWLGV